MSNDKNNSDFLDEIEQSIEREGGDFLSRHSALLELQDIQDASSVESRHVQFQRLCELVVVGYQGMSQEQIAAAPETPALMQYLIGALASYSKRIALLNASPKAKENTSPVSAGTRYKYLAEAFGLAEAHGGVRRGRLTLDWQMAALQKYVDRINAYDAKVDRNSDQARHAALEATYEDLFGPTYQHEPRQRAINLRKLTRVLNQHGYLRDGDFQSESK